MVSSVQIRLGTLSLSAILSDEEGLARMPEALA